MAKECDKYISKIIQKYTGKSPYYVKDSAHFAEMIKDLTVEEDEVLVSYDVTALYPSVPQEEAIEIIYQLMKEDPDLSEKNNNISRKLNPIFQNLCQDYLLSIQPKTVPTSGRIGYWSIVVGSSS